MGITDSRSHSDDASDSPVPSARREPGTGSGLPDRSAPVSQTYRQRQLLFAMLLFVAAVFTLAAIPSAPKNPGSFIQWLFNYDYGLIKRGLIGHLITHLRNSSDPISMAGMFYLATGLSLLTWTLYAAISIRAWRGKFGRALSMTGSWIIVLLIVAILTASPIGVSYYVSNSHNLEVVNLLNLAIFANIIFFRPIRPWPIAALISFSLISVLVHESALLSTIPVGFLIYVLLYAKPFDKKLLSLLLGLYVFCIALVVVAGINSRTVSQQIVDGVVRGVDAPFASAIQSKMADKTDVLQFTLADNMRKGFRSFTKPRHLTRAAFAVLVTAPAMLFLSLLLFHRLQRRMAIVAVMAGLLPLSLTLLADDVFRWLILTIVGLSVLSLAPAADHFKSEAMSDVTTHRGGSAPIIGLGIVALLTAVDLPYPYFMTNDGNPLLDAALKLGALIGARIGP